MSEYIDREKAIKYFCTNMNWLDEDGYAVEDREKVSNITDLVNGVPTADVIPLEKIKQAYVEIENLSGQSCMVSDGVVNDVLDILDKLIESEG